MRRHLWWILGLVLVAGGLAVVLFSRPEPTDYGWLAYAPARDHADWQMGWSDGETAGAPLWVSRWQLAGCALAVVGLTVVAAGLGFRLGRRRGTPLEQP